MAKKTKKNEKKYIYIIPAVLWIYSGVVPEGEK